MNDPEVVRFLRAAAQRFAAAEALVLESYYRDATYLGGYVIECLLKSLLLTRVPVRDRDRFVKAQFHGSRAHDYSVLMELLLRQGQTVPREIRQQIRRAGEIWSVDLRYTPGRGRADEADALLSAARIITQWEEERLR